MKYGIYIIESLKSADLKPDEQFDGEILDDILKVCGIQHEYEHVGTISDFKQAIENFNNSDFRYLHLSCHADYEAIKLGDEKVSYEDLSLLFKGTLNKKRVFMSACKAGNSNLAQLLIIANGAYSVIGSPISKDFDDFLLFWASLYKLISRKDENVDKIDKKALIDNIKKCSDLFSVPINYYSFVRNGKKWSDKFIREIVFTPNKKIQSSRKEIFYDEE
jgi:hypothetical protein